MQRQNSKHIQDNNSEDTDYDMPMLEPSDCKLTDQLDKTADPGNDQNPT
jgi:hypothetical protein